MTSLDEVGMKLLVIGNSGVGKTQMLSQYARGGFLKTQLSSIGVDFAVKRIDVKSSRVKLQIWDTAGQERFSDITANYYRGAQGLLLVYDVTDRESFLSLKNWMNRIMTFFPEDATVNIVLVGNKVDREDHRQVTYEEGAREASKYDRHIPFFETSAMTNYNITQAFETLADVVADRLIKEGRFFPTKKKPPLPTPKQNQSDCSCTNAQAGKDTEGSTLRIAV